MFRNADGRELTQELEPGSPISIYFSEFGPAAYDYIDWHWHDEFQFCLVTKGSILFRAAGHPYTVTAGNGIFINSRCIHTSRPSSSQTGAYLCLDVHPDFLGKEEHGTLRRRYVSPLLQENAPEVLPIFSGSPVGRRILSLLDRLCTLFLANKDCANLDIYILTVSVWKEMLSLLPGSAAPPPFEEPALLLKQILLFIRRSYSESVSLDDIASYVHLSRSECCRRFHRLTGQPLFRYLMQYRIDKSIELLLSTDRKISDIAAAVGFSGQSYYTACFRKQKSVTPGQFRRMRRTAAGRHVAVSEAGDI